MELLSVGVKQNEDAIDQEGDENTNPGEDIGSFIFSYGLSNNVGSEIEQQAKIDHSAVFPHLVDTSYDISSF